MSQIEIGTPKIRNEKDKFRISADIDIEGRQFTLWYQASHGPLSNSSDPFLVVSVPAAMKLNKSIGAANPISSRLISSLPVIMDIYHSWQNDMKPITIKTDLDGDLAEKSKGGVASFFSGGVDSFYTLLKHQDEIDTLIFVHGFDIRQEDTTVWERVSGPVIKAAAELGKPLIIVRTNVQHFTDQFMHWNYYHGAALASVALLFAPSFRKVYVPATHTYAHLQPWGSHPLLDPLWSTEKLEIVHDGCEASRYDKVTMLSSCEPALRYLRVCYKNRDAQWKNVYNCGMCEKCLRTQVSLYLAGVLDRCATFDHSLDLDAISRIATEDDNVRSHVQENLAAAERLKANPSLIGALQASLNIPTADFGRKKATDKLNDIIHRLEEENSALKMTVDALHQTRSWRITKPLRTIADAIRKLHL